MVSDIGMMVRVFANCLGDLGLIPGRVFPKTQKLVLAASLLNTQQYKVGTRLFANGPGDMVSIPDHVIAKTLEMVLDTSLLNTQQDKVCIKVKVEQSREWSSAYPYTLV